MNHKHTAVIFLSTLAFSGGALAEGWTFGPAFKDGWKPEFTVAGVGGALNPDHAGTGLYKGAEISLNCPWFQPPAGAIRQQFNIGSFKHDGMSLTSIEMNPNYFVSIGNGWTVGAGPGIGFVRGYRDGREAAMSSVQVSANVNYRSGPLFFGAGVRYQDTRNKEIAAGQYGADNWLVSAKVGINF
jgi:hypothetical protein